MKHALLVLMFPLLAACSSMQPVDVSDLADARGPAEIEVGDRVEVISRDGEKFEFTVTEINAIGLGGKFGFIPFQNMRRLSVRRPDTSGDGLVWVWGLLGAALVVAVIASADSVSVCSPGPCPPQ